MQNKSYLILLLGFFVIVNFNIYASTVATDSFKVSFLPVPNPLEEEKLFQQLSEQALTANMDLAIQYATRAWQLANKNGNKEGIAKSNIQLARIYTALKQYKNAISYYDQAIKIYVAQKNRLEEGKIYYQIANIHQLQQNFEAAEKYLNFALNLFTKEKNKLEEGKCLKQLGFLKSSQYLAEDATIFFQKAIDVFGEDSTYNIECTLAFIALGDQQRNLLQYKSALDNYFKALELTEFNSLNTYKQICISNIGWTFYLQEAYQEALIYCNEGLEIAKKEDNAEIIQQNNKCLGAVYLDLKDFDKAIYFLNQALTKSKERGSTDEMREIYKLLSLLYETKGDFKIALDFRKIHQSLNDTLLLQTNARQMAEVQSMFSLQVGEKVQDLLHAERESTDAKRNLKYVGYFGIGMFLLFFTTLSGFIYYLSNEKEAQKIRLQNTIKTHTISLEQSNEELQHVKEELKRFAYIASHDLKEPLRNIASFTTLIKRKVGDYMDKDTEDYFQFVMNNTQQITALVTDIFEYSQLDEEAITLSYINVNEIVQKSQEPLKKLIAAKNAQIECAELPLIYSNGSYLKLIFKNLIENGIKYNDSEIPLIKITFEEKDEDFVFKISDNGVGISKEYYDYIFEMFRRLHDRQISQGSGLGLAICKKVIRRLQGKISLDSEQGKGTTFYISLPKNGMLRSVNESWGKSDRPLMALEVSSFANK